MAREKLLVAGGVGTIVAAVAAASGASRAFALMGWDAAALVFCVWTWSVVWPMGPVDTARHSQRENPARPSADLVLLGAAAASVLAVGVVLFGASHAPGAQRYLQAALAVFSIFVSWTVVHTVFTLKYARAYYSAPEGGIDFNEPGPPQYSDFAYLAFTIGMTFQVSDTDLTDKTIRRIALRHAWMSYPLGAVIIAASINLISNLAK